MAYGLNRRLFLENGPAVFADIARTALATSDAYRLLRQARLAAAANCNAPDCNAAA